MVLTKCLIPLYLQQFDIKLGTVRSSFESSCLVILKFSTYTYPFILCVLFSYLYSLPTYFTYPTSNLVILKRNQNTQNFIIYMAGSTYLFKVRTYRTPIKI